MWIMMCLKCTWVSRELKHAIWEQSGFGLWCLKVSYPAVTFSTVEDDTNDSNAKNDNEQDNYIHWKKGNKITPTEQKS